MKIEIEITGCRDCPSLRKGRTYGNDGRDGEYVYICKNGAFGGVDTLYGDYGEVRMPKVPPIGCPYFKSTMEDRVADSLNITTVKLRDILRINKCKLADER